MPINMDTCPLTLNTTRICGKDAVNFAVEISKIDFSSMKPNAVILVNKSEVFDGIASAPLVHFPINAPILFTDGYSLSSETLSEIQRLAPKGYNGIQVFIVGNILKTINDQLQLAGFTSKTIAGRNHYETACKIPAERKDFKNILIVSGEDYSEGIITSYWSAHHGDPILFVRKNDIPPCTLDAIKNSKDISLYIVGSIKTVGTAVEEELSKLPNIKQLVRITGSSPYEISINFAGYKSRDGEFGWERNYRDGHAFSFGTLNNPMEITASVTLAHMGKHAPLLIINRDEVPQATIDYLKEVKPLPPKDMPRPPFMHGFILGNTGDIAYETQLKIDATISLEHEMTDMEHRSNEICTACPYVYSFRRVNADEIIY